jgi:hypothetical protein
VIIMDESNLFAEESLEKLLDDGVELGFGEDPGSIPETGLFGGYERPPNS